MHTYMQPYRERERDPHSLIYIHTHIQTCRQTHRETACLPLFCVPTGNQVPIYRHQTSHSFFISLGRRVILRLRRCGR